MNSAPNPGGPSELVLATDGAALTAAWLMVKSELRQGLRERTDLAQPLIFFVMVASLFPLGVGADTEHLAQLAAGLIWVSGLLAVLLSLPRLYARDLANGTLEQMLLSPYPLAGLCAGKIVAHWLLTGLPLAVLAPAIAIAFGLSGQALLILALALLLGTPVLSMLGAIAAALALGARASSVLVALLVLPLYVPVLVFGAGAVDLWRSGVDPTTALCVLGALVLFGVVLSPFAAAAALRISLD